MITNFEYETRDLSPQEIALIPVVIEILKNHNSWNPIKSPALCKAVDGLTGVRLRKMVNCIRRGGLLPVIATSTGYYCSYDTDEIKRQIASLEERARAIQASAEGLRSFIWEQGDLF
jgi:hypothetical protein